MLDKRKRQREKEKEKERNRQKSINREEKYRITRTAISVRKYFW